MKQEIKTFGLAGWEPRELPKHDIWPIISDNRKKMVKVLASRKHRP
jgi:hypothetical protein